MHHKQSKFNNNNNVNVNERGMVYEKLNIIIGIQELYNYLYMNK